MNSQLFETLTANESRIDAHYNSFMKTFDLLDRLPIPAKNHDLTITSRDFFFKVVYDHFENLSKMKINKVNSSTFNLICEIEVAANKASRACSSRVRKANTIDLNNGNF